MMVGMFENIIDLEKKFKDFTWPVPLLKVIDLGLIDYDRWCLIPPQQIIDKKKGLKKRYPKRKLIPFAQRCDNDDVACFEIGHGERVFIVHDFASEGWERRQEYDDFWSWFKEAIQELIDFEIEERAFYELHGTE